MAESTRTLKRVKGPLRIVAWDREGKAEGEPRTAKS